MLNERGSRSAKIAKHLKGKNMILRLTVHASDEVCRKQFVFESKVATSVRITYDFRSYEKLDSLGSLMRSLLWDEFAIGESGSSLEIVRSLTTSNLKYMESEEEYNLLWEYCAMLLTKNEAKLLK
jgi:hypothetical protein